MFCSGLYGFQSQKQEAKSEIVECAFNHSHLNLGLVLHRAPVLQNWGFRVVPVIKMRKLIVYDLTLQTRISTEKFSFQFSGRFCFSFDIFQVISLVFSTFCYKGGASALKAFKVFFI